MRRINVVMDEETVNKLDKIAKSQKKNRSKLLRDAVDAYIKEYTRIQEERRKREMAKRAVEIQNRLRKKAGRWNGVKVLREIREGKKR